MPLGQSRPIKWSCSLRGAQGNGRCAARSGALPSGVGLGVVGHGGGIRAGPIVVRGLLIEPCLRRSIATGAGRECSTGVGQCEGSGHRDPLPLEGPWGSATTLCPRCRLGIVCSRRLCVPRAPFWWPPPRAAAEDGFLMAEHSFALLIDSLRSG